MLPRFRRTPQIRELPYPGTRRRRRQSDHYQLVEMLGLLLRRYVPLLLRFLPDLLQRCGLLCG